MVEVSPFRGWRYDVSQVGDLSDVITPPYDVIDDKFQDQLYKQHPCNFIRLELNRSEPSDADANAKYGRAAEFLKHWKIDGVLRQEPEDAIYVYSQEFTWEGKTYRSQYFWLPRATRRIWHRKCVSTRTDSVWSEAGSIDADPSDQRESVAHFRSVPR